MNAADVILGLRRLVENREVSPEEKTSLFLSQLQDALNRASLGPEGHLVDLKKALINVNVLDFCVEALRLNHITTETGALRLDHITMETWRNYVLLAQLLSSCCVGVEPDQDLETFYRLFLPSVMDGLLSLASRLMSQVAKRSEYSPLYRKVMDSVSWILQANSYLTAQVLSSLHYEQMQMCDDVSISLVCVSLWIQMCTKSRDFLSGLSDDSVLLLLNDAVGLLAVSSGAAVGGAAIRLLILIASQLVTERRALLHTFTGLDRLLNKDWRGRGFNEEIDQLITFINSGRHTPGHAHSQVCCERVQAACVIQAAWRGYRTRSRIKSLPRAVSILQRKYRAKVRQQMQQEQTSRWEEELRYQVCIRRQRARRQFHQKQQRLLHLLPPGLVHRYQSQVECFAAVTIQKFWRGHRDRRLFCTLRQMKIQHRAACILQRAVLKFLKKRRSQKATPTYSLLAAPRGLTDGRRAELKKEIQEYVALYPSCVSSHQGCQQLLLQIQTLLLQHNTHLEDHTPALLAHINTHLDLLEDAPSLAVAKATDVELFQSRSGPVASRARQSHHEMLQASCLPWWRRLGQEHGDDITSYLGPTPFEVLEEGLGLIDS